MSRDVIRASDVDAARVQARGGSLTVEASDQPSVPPRFTMTAYTGGAIYQPWGRVVLDVDGVEANRQTIPILWNHDQDTVLGHATAIRSEGTAIIVEGVMSGANDRTREVIAAARNGLQWQSSIGADIVEREELAGGRSTAVNGQQVSGPIVIARRSLLMEVSIVPIGADRGATATVAATRGTGVAAMPTFSEWLQSLGIDEGSLTDDGRDTLQRQYDAVTDQGSATATETEPADDAAASHDDLDIRASRFIERQRAAIVAEDERVERIRQATHMHPGIRAQAIRDGWTADRAELEVLRAERQTYAGPVAVVKTSRPITATALALAACRSWGLAKPDAGADDQTRELADRYNGITPRELVQAAIPIMQGDERQRVEAERPGSKEQIAAAFGSHSFSTLVGDIAHKAVLDGFSSVTPVWEQIARRGTVSDFKEKKNIRYGIDTFGDIPRGGELPYTRIIESANGVQAQTRGTMISISREDFIDNNADNFSRLPAQAGRKAASKINRLVIEKIAAGTTNTISVPDAASTAAFWSSTFGNLVSGSSYALSMTDITGLSKALETFRKLVWVDGEPTDLEPGILLVPPELEAVALAVFQQPQLLAHGTAASAKVTAAGNPFYQRFKPVSHPLLSNSTVTGNSATAYYLLSDPATGVAIVECAFLNGQTTPTVERVDSTGNRLTMDWRVYLDVGVGYEDPKAGVRMAGA